MPLVVMPWIALVLRRRMAAILLPGTQNGGVLDFFFKLRRTVLSNSLLVIRVCGKSSNDPPPPKVCQTRYLKKVPYGLLVANETAEQEVLVRSIPGLDKLILGFSTSLLVTVMEFGFVPGILQYIQLPGTRYLV